MINTHTYTHIFADDTRVDKKISNDEDTELMQKDHETI